MPPMKETMGDVNHFARSGKCDVVINAVPGKTCDLGTIRLGASQPGTNGHNFITVDAVIIHQCTNGHYLDLTALYKAFKCIRSRFSDMRMAYSKIGHGLRGAEWPTIQKFINSALYCCDHTVVYPPPPPPSEPSLPPCPPKKCPPQPCVPQPCVPQPCIPQPCIPQPCIPQPCVPQPCVPEEEYEDEDEFYDETDSFEDSSEEEEDEDEDDECEECIEPCPPSKKCNNVINININQLCEPCPPPSVKSKRVCKSESTKPPPPSTRQTSVKCPPKVIRKCQPPPCIPQPCIPPPCIPQPCIPQPCPPPPKCPPPPPPPCPPKKCPPKVKCVPKPKCVPQPCIPQPPPPCPPRKCKPRTRKCVSTSKHTSVRAGKSTSHKPSCRTQTCTKKSQTCITITCRCPGKCDCNYSSTAPASSTKTGPPPSTTSACSCRDCISGGDEDSNVLSCIKSGCVKGKSCVPPPSTVPPQTATETKKTTCVTDMEYSSSYTTEGSSTTGSTSTCDCSVCRSGTSSGSCTSSCSASCSTSSGSSCSCCRKGMTEKSVTTTPPTSNCSSSEEEMELHRHHHRSSKRNSCPPKVKCITTSVAPSSTATKSGVCRSCGCVTNIEISSGKCLTCIKICGKNVNVNVVQRGDGCSTSMPRIRVKKMQS